MKPSHLGLLILALCLLDCAATHREWLTFPGVEGNPAMAWVIGAWGWGATALKYENLILRTQPNGQ